MEKTIADVEQIFRCPKMKEEITSYAKSCASCHEGKASCAEYGDLLQPLPEPQFPREVINIGLLLGLPKKESGLDDIVTFACQLYKMAHITPVNQSITVERLGKLFMREVVSPRGASNCIVSDRGSGSTVKPGNGPVIAQVL